MIGRMEKEVKRIEREFKEAEKKYPESITSEEIVDFEKKFRSDIGEASNQLDAEQKMVANLVLNHPEFIAKSSLQPDKIEELLIAAAYIEPLNTLDLNTDKTVHRTNFMGAFTDSIFCGGPLRTSLIPTATRTDPKDPANDVLHVKMLRSAALKLSTAYPHVFLQNISLLENTFGQKEKDGKGRPDEDGIKAVILSYFEQKKFEKPGSHAARVDTIFKRNKEKNPSGDNLTLYQNALAEYLPTLDKQLTDIDRERIASVAERAHLVKLYGDKVNDLSAARFDKMVVLAVQYAAMDSQHSSVLLKTCDKWLPRWRGHEQGRKIVTEAAKNTHYYAQDNLEKWLPSFKDHPLEVAEIILGILPLNESIPLWGEKNKAQDFIDFLQDNPKGPEIISAIAARDRDAILLPKFPWVKAVENNPAKVAEILVATRKSFAPEDGRILTIYDKLHSYILTHAEHFKEHPELITEALLYAQSQGPQTLLASGNKWRSFLQEPVVIEAFSEDKLINTAKKYVKENTEIALANAEEWIPDFAKRHPEITREMMLEAAANEQKFVLYNAAKITAVFVDQPKAGKEIITAAVEKAAAYSPSMLLTYLNNWWPAFKEKPKEADKLLIDAVKATLKVSSVEILGNAKQLMQAYTRNPEEMRGLIDEAARKEPMVAYLHLSSWLPLYKDTPHRLVVLVNTMAEGEAKEKLKEGIRNAISENEIDYPKLQKIEFDDPKPQSSITPTEQHPFAAIVQRADNPLPCTDIAAAPEGRTTSPAQKLPSILCV